MLIDDRLLSTTLRDRFGHEHFRAGQRDVISSVLEGHPTLAVMPTGTGKSLCFQLPALLLGGTALVVSPLVALMKDQVDALRGRGISAACINSSQPEATRAENERALAQGRLQLAYVAPERFRNPAFRRALAKAALSLVAVDEAHCVSEWGHAFRPDYALLGDALEELSPPRLVALTATAPPDARADIVRALRMRRPRVIVAGFDRPNIHFEVHQLAGDAEKKDTVLAAVRAHHPAIVYTATRRQAEAIARHLNVAGTPSRPYHAGLDPTERHRTQEAFQANEIPVVTATNAFGLGVDKPDVRLVLHADLPRSIEAYYQEAGRAGRDGRNAISAVLFGPKDIFVQQALLTLSTPPARTVAAVHAITRASRTRLSREELVDRLRSTHRSASITAALGFLESLRILRRTSAGGPLRLRLRRNVAPDGETAASAVARLLGGSSGSVEEDALATALGVSGRSELDTLLGDLDRRGEIRVTRGKPRTCYEALGERELSREDLKNLRTREARDRTRLQEMVRLVTRHSCRRKGLLHALGEPLANRCSGCDVCAGTKLQAIRSQLQGTTRRHGWSDMGALTGPAGGGQHPPGP